MGETIGVTMRELASRTTARLDADGNYAVMDVPVGDVIVVPSFALERNQEPIRVILPAPPGCCRNLAGWCSSGV